MLKFKMLKLFQKSEEDVVLMSVRTGKKIAIITYILSVKHWTLVHSE